jgi:hypothetical protein
VYWDCHQRGQKKWTASLKIKGKRVLHARFDDKAAAVAARREAEAKHGVAARFSWKQRLERRAAADYCSAVRNVPERGMKMANMILAENSMCPKAAFPYELTLTPLEIAKACAVQCPVFEQQRTCYNNGTCYPISDDRQQQRAMQTVFHMRDMRMIANQLKLVGWLYKMALATTAVKRTDVMKAAKRAFLPPGEKPGREPHHKERKVAKMEPCTFAGVRVFRDVTYDDEGDEEEQRALVTLPKWGDGIGEGESRKVFATEAEAAMAYDQHCREHKLDRRVNFPLQDAAKRYLVFAQQRSEEAGRKHFCKDPHCRAAAHGFTYKRGLTRHATTCAKQNPVY